MSMLQAEFEGYERKLPARVMAFIARSPRSEINLRPVAENGRLDGKNLCWCLTYMLIMNSPMLL